MENKINGMADMKKIHDLSLDWLTEQDRLIEGELYISRYYMVSESAADRPVWVLEIEEDLIIGQPDKFINLLCQKTRQGKLFYHLKLPSGFLSVCKHLLAYDDTSKRYTLHLSAEQASLFRDLNGIGNVDFSIFNVDH